MKANASAWSRRAVLSGVINAAAVSATWGEAPMRPDRLPPLRTVSSQFVELRPLVFVPPLKLERIDGKTVSLDQFHGKAVLVNFWATWCAPCRRELPLLDDLLRTTGRGSFEIIAVSIDQAGRQAVIPFLRRLNVTLLHPFLDSSGRIAKPMGEDSPAPFTLWGMPISYMIDRQGRLAGYITGEVDWTSDSTRVFLNYYASA
jgi:thiol-disulfide isomerase/thioredoxin